MSNSGRLHPALASSLLRSLLTQLSEEALTFLASVWTIKEVSATPALRVAALRHGLAFVNAYKVQTAGIDFQLVVPALVIALQDDSKAVRTAGVALLKAISGSGAKEGAVYAVDTFYGSQSSKFARNEFVTGS
jgi:U3 small nucleolar RNA-associated protein 10